MSGTRHAQFLLQSRSQFVTGQNFDFVLNARVVGQHYVVARTIAKEADNGRMRPVENAYDAPFGALRSGKSAYALDAHEHMIAVHRIFNRIARNKNVAINLRQRRIGHNKAIAIVMQHEPAVYFVPSGEGLSRPSAHILRGAHTGPVRSWLPTLPVGFSAGQTVAPPGQFLNGPSFFELREHFVQGANVGFLQVQTEGDIAVGYRFSANLQKTKDVIWAELRRSRHFGESG